MKNPIIYYSSIEYNYDENSVDYIKYAGGFVYAFVKSINADQALKMILSALNNNNLKVKNLEFIEPYDLNMEWDTYENKENFKNIYREAILSDEVIFDIFYAYEKE